MSLLFHKCDCVVFFYEVTAYSNCIVSNDRVLVFYEETVHLIFMKLLFRIARAGIFPRSSLFGAGQLGFGGGGIAG